jgi:hypothetical protein
MSNPPSLRASPAQQLDFFERQITPLTGSQRAVSQIANGGPNQPLHRVALTLEKLAHLVRLALTDQHAPPRVGAAARRSDQLHEVWHHALAFDHGAVPDPVCDRHGRHATDLRLVFAQDTVAGVRETQGEVSVTRKHEQSLGVEVQTADRIDPLAHLAVKQTKHRWAAFRIVRRRDHTRRLVKQQIAWRGRRLHPLAVDLDGIGLEVGLLADPRDATVDGHSPGTDPLLCLPARTEPGTRDQFLQSLKCHWCLRPPARPPPESGEPRDRASQSVPGTPWSCGTEAACQRPACVPPRQSACAQVGF